jgi:hypothetical protein
VAARAELLDRLVETLARGIDRPDCETPDGR